MRNGDYGGGKNVKGSEERGTVPKTSVKRSNKPLAGGILILLAGIGTLVFVLLGYLTYHTGPAAQMLRGYTGIIDSLSILWAVTAIPSVLGGLLAIGRRSFGGAMIGAVCSLIGIGFLLGAPGLVLVVLSRDEFPKNSKKQDQSLEGRREGV